MSLRLLLQRGLAAALLCLAPQIASAQFTTTGPGAPGPVAPAELFGRDETGFDAPYQAFGQTFQPFVGGSTSGFLQTFTVWLQGANVADPTIVPTFEASIWTIGTGPQLSLSSVLRTTSGPTGSTVLDAWKAVTFDFTNLQLTKNVTYAFVLAVTGYSALPDGAINYVAMNDGTASGAVFGAAEGSTAVGSGTTWTRLDSGDPVNPRTLAYSATFTTSVVPEPSTIVLVTIGGVALLVIGRRRAA